MEAVRRGPGERRSRRLETADGPWLAVEALRARSGHGLLYFLPLGGEAPAGDDRRDRRAVLEPGEELADLDAERLEALRAAAPGLTETERRFVDAEGEVWLVQNVGPVWAEGGVAEGLTGLAFTRLTGAPARRRAPGGHVAAMSEPELRARLAAAERD